MRAFVLLACVALAYGRPEPPSPYRYTAPAPSSGYGAPSSSYGAPSSSYAASSTGGNSALSFGGDSSSFSSGSYSQIGQSNQGYAGAYSGAPLVQKHIYVHVPPQEQQEVRAPRVSEVAPPQKHYKIIFIKAPTPPAPSAPIIPVQPQNEEKTLVYVLVKKPEEQPDIVIPTPAPTQPAKPEVYFIKYQTQKQSSGAELGAVSGAELAAVSGATGAGQISGGDFSGVGQDSGSDAGQLSPSQYGPPGHVAGPLH